MLGSLLVPSVASVLGAAVVAMGTRVVVAVAGLFGAAVVAIGTGVEVAVAAVLGAAVSLDCWGRADCGVPHPENFIRYFTSLVSTIPHLCVDVLPPLGHGQMPQS